MSKDTNKPGNNVRFAQGLDQREKTFQPDQVVLAAEKDSRTREDGERVRLDEVAPRTVGVMEEQFPNAELTAYDPRDKQMEARLALQQPDKPGYTPFGKLIARDEDFEWYQKKAAAAETAAFQQWFAEQFDLMDPAQKKRAKELYPKFYAQRMRTLEQNAQNLVRLAKIKLDGAEDLNDVETLYLAENGRLNLGPLQNLLKPESSLKLGDKNLRNKQDKIFTRGLLNPFQVYGKQAYPSTKTGREDRAKIFETRNLSANDSNFREFKDRGDASWFKQLQSATKLMDD